MYQIDLNCDLGEGFGRYDLGNDEAVLRCISSASIACGFHAGDALLMQKTVRMCKERGVAVGAHPSFPDLQGFGRREMKVSPREVQAMIQYQIGALKAFCDEFSVELHHVKPHGALYNMAARDYTLAQAICAGIQASAPQAVLLALSGSEMLRAANDCGLRCTSEVFADRNYLPDGTLAPRSSPGAVIEDEAQIASRVIRMVTEGKIRCMDGSDLDVQADSVCVHGDNPAALAIVQSMVVKLREAGIEVMSF